MSSPPVRLTLGIYALTLFVSATLLFLVQPMIGKMTLPLLGGTPAVWNTCMVFFQAALLAGYAYAHVTTTYLGARKQTMLHLIVMFIPFIVLPITVDERWALTGEANPIPYVLAMLLLSVGLPFFVVSTSAPVLQKWFASTGHPAARDPYFLYGASNLGSMLALLAYPLLVEPSMLVRWQSWAWAGGYGVLLLLTASCAWLLWKAPVSAAEETAVPDVDPVDEKSHPVTFGRRMRWLALATVPSSLLLGVTTHITTDIAAIPLLWVLPLAVYLLTFILVFSRLPKWFHQVMVLLLPIVVLMLVFIMASGISPTFWVTWVKIGADLLVLFLAAMVCHGELALDRPSTRHLTEFYLWMSLGGVLGGAFNALIAPLIFTTIAEYRLAMVLACALMPRLMPGLPIPAKWQRLVDVGVAAGIGLLTLEMIHDMYVTSYLLAGLSRIMGHDNGYLSNWFYNMFEQNNTRFNLEEGRLQVILAYGLPLALCYIFVERPVRFALCLGAFLIAVALPLNETNLMFRTRSFFGVLEVNRSEIEAADGSLKLEVHSLTHGTTLHGKQFKSEQYGREPLTYYHRFGPVGQFFEACPVPEGKRDMAFIGLGTGTLAAYSDPGDKVTYYEIDAAVQRVAFNTEYFSYAPDAQDRGVDLKVVLGDARLRMREAPDHKYDIIVVDAFSSDAIPIHLITLQALEMYLQKLKETGFIVFHISNRHLDLEPVIGNMLDHPALIDNPELKVPPEGLVSYVMEDDAEEGYWGKTNSTWVVVSRRPEDLGTLLRIDQPEYVKWREELSLVGGLPGGMLTPPPITMASWQDNVLKRFYRWRPIYPDPKVGVWTDDYSNLPAVFYWKR